MIVLGDWHGACNDVTRTVGATLSVVMSTKHTPAHLQTDKSGMEGCTIVTFERETNTDFVERCVTRAIKNRFYCSVSQRRPAAHV